MARKIDPKALRKWRQDAGYTQEDVARLIGVTGTAYRNYETGRTSRMAVGTLDKLEALMTGRAIEAATVYSSTMRAAYCDTLAAELRLLADTIQSEQFTGEAKARRFEAAISAYSNNIADYVEALRG